MHNLTENHAGINSETDTLLEADTFLEAIAAISGITFPSLNEAIEAHLTLACRLTGTKTAFVSRFDTQLHMLFAVDTSQYGIKAGDVFPVEEAFRQYIRAIGNSVVIRDADHEPHAANGASFAIFGVGSYLGVPFPLTGGAHTTMLCVVDTGTHRFSTAHIHALRILAHHVVMLIEQYTHPHAQTELTPITPTEQNTLMQMVAHDLRTPLTSIVGYVELLHMNMFGTLAHEQRHTLQHILNHTRFMNRLVNDLVDVTAAKTGKLSLICDTFKPNHLAQLVVDTCQVQAQARGLTLTCIHTEQLPLMVGDGDRLQQILYNIINNALRYTVRGSVTMYVTQHDTQVQFTVVDTGPGIAAEHQQSVWQPYIRVSSRQAGLGLGLYIVYQLASAMGGTVGMQSVPDQGSTFWVRLPLQGPALRPFEWDT